MSKYRNIRTKLDGYTWDSKKEMNYYLHLKMLKKSEFIRHFDIKPKYVLIPKTGKDRELAYIADFRVIDNDGTMRVIDVKGVRTQVYKIKKRLMWHVYKIRVEEV